MADIRPSHPQSVGEKGEGVGKFQTELPTGSVNYEFLRDVYAKRGNAKVKIENVKQYGAEVDLIDTARISRLDRVAQLEEQLGATAISPYDDPWVIAGKSQT